MSVVTGFQIKKVLPGPLGMVLLLGLGPAARGQQAGEVTASRYYSLRKVEVGGGKVLEQAVIKGPPKPPPGFELQRQAASLPSRGAFGSSNALTVPAFTWVFGCSAVSGAMIAGYYDRNGFPNLYTGPTNGGVMPLDNSSWPTWSDGYDTYPNCPLIASKNGVDGRATKGTLDDYWVKYDSSAEDPYITGAWTQHAWGTAIGDYMKTSQSAFDNTDGSTAFYNWTSLATPLTCEEMAGYALPDGTLGRKLFYEAQGYTCTTCYNQKTDNVITGGFTYAQFKAEIDAGRPVMLNLEGHTVVGVGYDNATSLVYLHDTWDYSNHTMTWGGSYSGMALQSVSIVNLSPALPSLLTFSPTSGLVGSTVTLTGADFLAASSVAFNGTATSNFTIVSATQITVAVPTGATSGKIVVTTPDGLAQSNLDFTVITYDMNGDGLVDLKDLARLARYFGTTRAADPTGFQAQYDLNGDGAIDELDISLFYNHLD